MAVVGDLFRQLREIANSIVVGVLVVLFLAAQGIAWLEMYFDPAEMALTCLIFLAVVIAAAAAGRRRLTARFRPAAVEAAPVEWLDIIEDYGPSRRKRDLPLGVDDRGKVHEMRMKGADAHLLVTGPTGTGKSTFLSQFLIAAARTNNYQSVLVARSSKDFQPLAAMRNVHLVTYDQHPSVAGELDRYAADLPGIVEAAHHEMARRQNLLTRHGARDIGDIRADSRPPLVLFVIEEFTGAADLISVYGSRQDRQTFYTQVLTLVQQARATGIFVVLASQTAPNIIPTPIRRNMAKLAFRVGSAQEAYWATGLKDSGAETLGVVDPDNGAPGEMIFVGAFGHKRLTVPFVTDVDLTAAAAQHQAEIKDLGPPTWLGRFLARPQAPENMLRQVNGASPPAAAPPRRIPALSPALVVRFVELRYQRHADFETARNSHAYTLDRTCLVALGHFAGLPENRIMQGVFNGRNDRYRDYVKLVGGHVDFLRRAHRRDFAPAGSV